VSCGELRIVPRINTQKPAARSFTVEGKRVDRGATGEPLASVALAALQRMRKSSVTRARKRGRSALVLHTRLRTGVVA